MTSEEARDLIRKRSMRDADLDNFASSDSFIGSLRPFVGLSAANFHELMTALRVLAPSLGTDSVDRELMSDLWFILWQANLVGLDRTGALQRNNVLSGEETDMLADWVFHIGSVVSNLLEGDDVTIAFSSFDSQYGS